MTPDRELIHARIDRQLVQAIDACAMLWGTSRTEAANRLLTEAIDRRRGELVAFAEGMIERFAPPVAGEEDARDE